MGRTLLLGAPVTLLWAAAIGKLPALRRQPDNRALRAYWLALLALAVAVTVLLPPIQLAVDHATGVPNLARLLGHSLALVNACAAQAFLLYSSYQVPSARPRVRRRGWALAVTLALMGALFILGKVQNETLDFIGRYGTATPILVYWLIFLTYLGLALVDVVRLSWRWARLTDQAVLGLGLRVTAAGGVIGLCYVGYDLLFLAASHFGRARLLGNQPLTTQVLIAGAIALIVLGSTMPAWARRVGLPRLLRWASHYRAHRRLYPLWRRLCQVVPEVALVPPPSPQRDALTMWNLDFGLHRRVIEIHDARLALRPYLDPWVADTATELCRRAGLDGDDLRAVVEATSLAAAVHAKAQGRPATQARTVTAVGGGDLESESGWLVKVATAYARSPLVPAVLTRQQTEQDATVHRQGISEAMTIRDDRVPPGRQRLPGRLRAARLVTEALAPAPIVAVLPLIVAWHATSTAAGAIAWGVTASLFASVLPFAVILVGVRRGRLTDHHVGVRQQRILPMLMGIASVLIGLGLLVVLHAPLELVALVAAMTLGLSVSLLITLWWKVSVHTAVAAGAATVLMLVFGPALLAAWPLVGVIGWSRVQLGDHTPTQVLGGAALGAGVAAAVFPLLR
jgi:membrane-associated phospholipid phosphatase